MGTPADVRLGGTWTTSQRAKNGCIRGLVRAVVALVDRLPARLVLMLGGALGSLAYTILPGLRRHACAQIRTVMPTLDANRIAACSFRTAGENLGRCLLLRRPEVRATDWVVVPAQTRQVLDRTLAERRGCVVMSAHLGPFEYIAAVVRELGYHASVVVRESYDPGLNELVDAHRSSRGLNVIHRGAPNAAIAIVRALRRGHLVGMLPDLPGRAPTAPIELLGAVAPFAIGPERIASRAKVPVMAAWLDPLGDGTASSPLQRPAFQLRLERILTGPEECGATQRMADCVAAAMRRSPQHCLWMGMNFQMFSPNTQRTLTRLGT